MVAAGRVKPDSRPAAERPGFTRPTSHAAIRSSSVQLPDLSFGPLLANILTAFYHFVLMVLGLTKTCC
jgi:hypothetical protein